jgi:peptide/nickel transport system ATP-binding protein
MPAGCAFADRCTLVVDDCRSALPAPALVGPTHRVCCIRAEELACSAPNAP